jgi:DNA-binding CsgD family transcriptional regulator
MWNIITEILLTGIQFITLRLLFLKIYPQEHKIKKIMLICLMIIWRPLIIILNHYFNNSEIIKIMFEITGFIIIIMTCEKKYSIITSVFLLNIGFLINAISFCFFTGLNNNYPIINISLYFQNIISQITIFLCAFFYYKTIYAAPKEAINRIPLYFWVIILVFPLIGAMILFAFYYPLKIVYEVSIYNYFVCVSLGFLTLIFDLVIFYLYIKVINNYNTCAIAGELNKTPPVYSLRNGFTEEFTNKYELSRKQIKVAEALLEGKSNKEIATLLDIEVNTVQVHLQNIYRKTGSPGRYAFIALVGKTNGQNYTKITVNS